MSMSNKRDLIKRALVELEKSTWRYDASRSYGGDAYACRSCNCLRRSQEQHEKDCDLFALISDIRREIVGQV